MDTKWADELIEKVLAGGDPKTLISEVSPPEGWAKGLAGYVKRLGPHTFAYLLKHLKPTKQGSRYYGRLDGKQGEHGFDLIPESRSIVVADPESAQAIEDFLSSAADHPYGMDERSQLPRYQMPAIARDLIKQQPPPQYGGGGDWESIATDAKELKKQGII